MRAERRRGRRVLAANPDASVSVGWLDDDPAAVESLIDAGRRAVADQRLILVRDWEQHRRGLHRALHDRAQQQLLGLRMEVLRGVSGDQLDCESVVVRINEIGDEIERLARGLPPSALQIDDMASALREIAEQSGITVALDLPASLSTSVVVGELLTYTAGEALANVLRHTEASGCALALAATEDAIRLTIDDPGPAREPDEAQMRDGHGLAELRSRAELLGGCLDVTFGDSEHPRTVVALTLPNLSVDSDIAPEGSDEAVATWPCRTRDHLRVVLDDPTVDVAFLVVSEWLDELGTRVDHRPHWATVLADGEGTPLARVASSRDTAVVVDACSRATIELVEGHRRARAASALAEVRSEQVQVARRAAAIESSLARRLTSRPLEILGRARRAMTVDHDLGATAAALLDVSDAIREIVTVLDSDAASVAAAHHGDPFLFVLLGREFGVDVKVDTEQLPPRAERDAIAAMGERIIVDSAPGSQPALRVHAGAGRAVLRAMLDMLPSPRALAFIEDTVTWWGGELACEPYRDGIRLQAVLPCAR